MDENAILRLAVTHAAGLLTMAKEDYANSADKSGDALLAGALLILKDAMEQTK